MGGLDFLSCEETLGIGIREQRAEFLRCSSTPMSASPDVDSSVLSEEDPDDFWSDLAKLPALDELSRQLENEAAEDPLAPAFGHVEEEEDFFRSVLNAAPFKPSNQYMGAHVDWTADCWNPSKGENWWQEESSPFESGAAGNYSEEYGFDSSLQNSWQDYYISWNNADPAVWSAETEGWSGNPMRTESGKTVRGRPVRSSAPVPPATVQSADDKGILFPHKSVPKRKVIKGTFDEKSGALTTAM